MRVPISWLRTLVPGLTASADEIAGALLRAGLEVEQVDRIGHDITGVVVGQVLDVEVLSEFKKPIRYCHVDIGSRVHEVVCGATNFAVGDRVAFATPGAGLPGGFQIATRQTYGRTSDGMICSAAELGLSDDADGILVLDPTTALGTDVVALLGLRDEVLDIAVTPDRGYVLSLRGMARETATAFGLTLTDPARIACAAAGNGPEVHLEDPACDRYVARTVTGLDPAATSPDWLKRRLTLAGMRPVSLAVDITNHVMLELGQPLHAFDAGALTGAVRVRRAGAGETLRTLDGQSRTLDATDLVIADDSGPLALAGVMGGASTEVTGATTSLLIESAHFAAGSVARTARRHKLPSEASKRFERGVDPEIAAAAAQLAVQLLLELGGATAGPVTDLRTPAAPTALLLPVDQPGRVAGRPYAPEVVIARLTDVGCTVSGESVLTVIPPSWRPDLTGAAELVEEVVRLEGYDTIPVLLPTAPAGAGLTAGQRLRRSASRTLASAGLIEVATPPFVSAELLEALGYDQPTARLLNPLSEAEALLRPLLLTGVLGALLRSTGRGLNDLALFEVGLVFQGTGSQVAPPPVTGRPTDAQLAALDAALPRQPRHAALVLAGQRHGRAVDAADPVEIALLLARQLGVQVTVRPSQQLPWHPGRCVQVLLTAASGVETVVGHAGELHPRVVADLGLPGRTCAAELDLDVLVEAAAARGPATAPVVSNYPPSSVDVALVVAEGVPAAEVGAALREGAGPLLEDLHLFDVYTGPQVPAGSRSLAWALRMRAADRTLTDGEVLAARDAAVAEAHRRTGAALRSLAAAPPAPAPLTA